MSQGRSLGREAITVRVANVDKIVTYADHEAYEVTVETVR